MHDVGFTDLTGIEPYIEHDLDYGNGVVVWKRTLDELDGKYDFIMLHHVLEHMADPLGTLEHVHRLLKRERFALIRIPVAGTYAWRTYGSDWVQLDAPRHLFLHTERSLTTLAERSGFEVTDALYDSTGFQFWGSEQYRRNIPLLDTHASQNKASPRSSLFSKAELRSFKERAEKLNLSRDGDQACFYLRRG